MRYNNAIIVSVIFCIMQASCFVYPASGIATSTDDEVIKIQEAYKTITDIKASFIQKSFIKDLKRTDTFTGSLYIKRPSKMRWEYKGEKPHEVIIINNTILIHKKAEKQAFKGMFDRQTYGQAPVALLNGFGTIRNEFNISGENGKLLLKPKNPMGNIISIELELSENKFPIKSFIINDIYANKIEISLKDIEINTGLKDSFFSFSLPEGVSIYEHNP